jgi:hypothetical protein
MRQMTTVYLDDKHYKYFKKHKNVEKSDTVRKALDSYLHLEEDEGVKQ